MSHPKRLVAFSAWALLACGARRPATGDPPVPPMSHTPLSSPKSLAAVPVEPQWLAFAPEGGMDGTLALVGERGVVSSHTVRLGSVHAFAPDGTLLGCDDSSIASVSFTGTEPTRTEWKGTPCKALSFSPSGGATLFRTDAEGASFLFAPRGHAAIEPSIIAFEATVPLAQHEILWAPDGGRFLRWNSAMPGSVRRPADLVDLVVSAEHRPLVSDSWTANGPCAWSPDARYLACSAVKWRGRYVDHLGIVALDTSQKELSLVELRRTVQISRRIEWIGSEWVAFALEPPPARRSGDLPPTEWSLEAVHVTHPDEVVTVVRDPMLRWATAPSHDFLAYDGPCGRAPGVCTRRFTREGAEPARLLAPGSFDTIAWSPDGRHLLATQGRSLVLIEDARGDTPRLVVVGTAPPGYVIHGEFSPGSRWITVSLRLKRILQSEGPAPSSEEAATPSPATRFLFHIATHRREDASIPGDPEAWSPLKWARDDRAFASVHQNREGTEIFAQLTNGNRLLDRALVLQGEHRAYWLEWKP